MQETTQKLMTGFEFAAGLFDLVVPVAELYPDLHSLPLDTVYNDRPERVRWRTKQNYDVAYLMMYAHTRGKYYLQVRLFRNKIEKDLAWFYLALF